MKVLIIGGASACKLKAIKHLFKELGLSESILIFDGCSDLDFNQHKYDSSNDFFIEEAIPSVNSDINEYIINENLKPNYEKPKNQTVHRNHCRVHRVVRYRNKNPNKRM